MLAGDADFGVAAEGQVNTVFDEAMLLRKRRVATRALVKMAELRFENAQIGFGQFLCAGKTIAVLKSFGNAAATVDTMDLTRVRESDGAADGVLQIVRLFAQPQLVGDLRVVRIPVRLHF